MEEVRKIHPQSEKDTPLSEKDTPSHCESEGKSQARVMLGGAGVARGRSDKERMEFGFGVRIKGLGFRFRPGVCVCEGGAATRRRT